MNPKVVIEEFVLALEYYMDYYGLYGVDIKKLLKATTDIVNDLKNGKNGPTITKAESISQIFGLRYYQLVDPEFPPLSKEKLPKATITTIEDREENGPPKYKGKYNKLDLKRNLLTVLIEFVDSEKFLPSQVFTSLPQDLKRKLSSATRITGLFSNELKNNVQKTGEVLETNEPGRPEEYYRVISLEDKK